MSYVGLKSPPRLHCKLAPIVESESSDVVAIGLDRPFSDDVQVNISSSSSKDEGHLNLPATESEVGTIGHQKLRIHRSNR